MSVPIIDHVLVRAVLLWHARALHPIVIGPSPHAFGLPGRHAMGVTGVLRLRLIVRCWVMTPWLCVLRAFLVLFLRTMFWPLRATWAGLCKSTQ